AKRFKTLPERTQGPIALPTGTIPGEAGRDSVEEILLTERFCQEFNGTPLHRLHGHWDIGMCRNEDDGRLSIRRGQVALKVQTALLRHSHVQHQASWAVRRGGLEKIGSRRKFLRVQPN